MCMREHCGSHLQVEQRQNDVAHACVALSWSTYLSTPIAAFLVA